MKALTIISLGAAALLAACTSRPADGFSLTGHITGADNTTVCLSYNTGDSSIIDSAAVKDGMFQFSGRLEHPAQAVLYIPSDDPRQRVFVPIFIEPAKMTIDSLTVSDFSHPVMTGSKTQAQKDSLDVIINDIYAQVIPIRELLRNPATSPDSVAILQHDLDSLAAIARSFNVNFVKTHPSSYYSGSLLWPLTSHLEYDELRELYDNLTPEVQASIPEVTKIVMTRAAIQPGQPAPDVTGVNQHGDSIKMSDLRGKVVLLDFWATWCVPCRASFPHVKEVYNKYHDKGLEVFCVADNDSNPDQWKEVIISDGLENYHHVLRGLKEVRKDGQFVNFDRSNDQSAKYAIHYIPSKFLIAADGTMIGRFDDEKELDAKLAEIFNY